MTTIGARTLLGLTISALLAVAALPAAAAPRTCAVPFDFKFSAPNPKTLYFGLIIEKDSQIEPIIGTDMFVAGGNLFRITGDTTTSLDANNATGRIWSTRLAGDTVLVSTLDQLFLIKGDWITRANVPIEPGPIYSALLVGRTILVGAFSGLLVLDGERQTLLRSFAKTGPVLDIQTVGGAILVGADNGLFRLEGDELTLLGAGTDTGRISKIQAVGGTPLIAAARGLFRLEGDELTLLGAGTDTGSINAVQTVSGTILVGAENGLFRLDGDLLTRLGAGTDTGTISSIEQIGGMVLVSTEKGLYRLESNDMQEVQSDKPLAPNPHIWLIDNQLWIAAGDELFRYFADTGRVSGPKEPFAFGTATTASLRFTLPPCLGLLRPSQFGLIPESSIPFPAAMSPTSILAEFAMADTPTRRVLTATVGPLQAGTHRVRLAVKAGDGWEPVSDPVELRVDWTPIDYATHFIGQAIPWLATVHTGLFVLLLAGARRSAWCWRVASDPLWGRAGLWWHAALRHVPPLQRWVMARWFAAARRRDWRPYLLVPLAAPDGTVLVADILLDRLRTQPRLWLQGSAGMGKSALVDELSRQFFADHTSLRAAYRRYGFVPIVVRLRDVLDVKADPAQPDRWVPELARLALRGNGLRVDDPALFRALLESGYFALILDGANETANAAALEDYARTTPEVRILVTSQADPVKPGFEILRLPTTVEQLVGPLLAMFLGPARGAAVLEAVRSTPLWDGLASGYDVRLLADLAGRDGPVPELPADRIGLYRALLARLQHAGGAYPEAELSRAAWAMWRDGVRRFDSTKYLTPDLIEPLRHEEARVVRTISGTLHEFRHDQMRGYLAALWAARHEVAPVRLFETDKAIWRLGFSEQAVVWDFFASLIDQARGEAIWQWCHDDPERAVLLHALDQCGRRDGWALVRNAPEQVVPTVAR